MSRKKSTGGNDSLIRSSGVSSVIGKFEIWMNFFSINLKPGFAGIEMTFELVFVRRFPVGCNTCVSSFPFYHLPFPSHLLKTSSQFKFDKYIETDFR